MGQLAGRGLARSEQITGRERDRIAVRLRERYEQGATIRDLEAQTGRSYGWVRTLLLEADVVLRGRGGDHREHGSTTQHPDAASQVPVAGARTVMNRPAHKVVSALMLQTLVVGCAARFLPGRQVVVAAVACRDGGHTETIPAAEPAGSAVAAQAVAAILGLELATNLGYQSITLMLTGRLTLCAQLRTRAPVPELDTDWNERLRHALAPVHELSTISTSPDTTGTLQATATARCKALAAAATVPRVPRPGGVRRWSRWPSRRSRLAGIPGDPARCPES